MIPVPTKPCTDSSPSALEVAVLDANSPTGFSYRTFKKTTTAEGFAWVEQGEQRPTMTIEQMNALGFIYIDFQENKEVAKG